MGRNSKDLIAGKRIASEADLLKAFRALGFDLTELARNYIEICRNTENIRERRAALDNLMFKIMKLGPIPAKSNEEAPDKDEGEHDPDWDKERLKAVGNG